MKCRLTCTPSPSPTPTLTLIFHLALLMSTRTNDDYSCNSYKSIEVVFNFGSSIVCSATECALFEYEICIHIASEVDITGNYSIVFQFLYTELCLHAIHRL